MPLDVGRDIGDVPVDHGLLVYRAAQKSELAVFTTIHTGGETPADKAKVYTTEPRLKKVIKELLDDVFGK